MFPHPESGDVDKCASRPGGGLFTDLEQYVGVGFDAADAVTVTQDISDGGILKWTESSLDMARKAGVGGAGASLQQKQLVMASYLFECVYDLLIGDQGVSTNPGFESVIRYYGES